MQIVRIRTWDSMLQEFAPRCPEITRIPCHYSFLSIMKHMCSMYVKSLGKMGGTLLLDFGENTDPDENYDHWAFSTDMVEEIGMSSLIKIEKNTVWLARMQFNNDIIYLYNSECEFIPTEGKQSWAGWDGRQLPEQYDFEQATALLEPGDCILLDISDEDNPIILDIRKLKKKEEAIALATPVVAEPTTTNLTDGDATIDLPSLPSFLDEVFATSPTSRS